MLTQNKKLVGALLLLLVVGTKTSIAKESKKLTDYFGHRLVELVPKALAEIGSGGCVPLKDKRLWVGPLFDYGLAENLECSKGQRLLYFDFTEENGVKFLAHMDYSPVGSTSFKMITREEAKIIRYKFLDLFPKELQLNCEYSAERSTSSEEVRSCVRTFPSGEVWKFSWAMSRPDLFPANENIDPTRGRHFKTGFFLNSTSPKKLPR